MQHLQLPNSIESVEQAKALLDLLYKNDLLYHCEDDATDCLEHKVSNSQAKHLNKLMSDIYGLPGNEDRRVLATFDPCEYSLILLNI